MPRKRNRDTPGQEVMGEILGVVKKLAETQQDQMHLSVPAGAVVTVAMPGAAPLTPARTVAGFKQLMALPDREFHEALLEAHEQGLDLVAFNKRVHGAFYHAFNRKRKRGG